MRFNYFSLLPISIWTIVVLQFFVVPLISFYVINYIYLWFFCYVSDARGLAVLCNAVVFCCVIFLSFFFKFENKTGLEGVRHSLVVSFLTFMCMAWSFLFSNYVLHFFSPEKIWKEKQNLFEREILSIIPLCYIFCLA